MQKFSRETLWLLVVLLVLGIVPFQASAEGEKYLFAIEYGGENIDLEFLSCDLNTHPILVISDVGQTDFKPVEGVGPCQLFMASLPLTTSLDAILIQQEGDTRVIDITERPQSFFALSSEVKSVLIFIGGLLAAMVGRVLALILDPIYHSVKLIMKYRATKRFFASVSDSFDKDFAISDDLYGVARGEFLTNFLFTTNLRKKIQNLLSYIEDWKRNELDPKDFRDRLSKL